MPTLNENIHYWEKVYPWEDEGQEWSMAWGSPNSQWFGTILLRIKDYLPVKHLLEIAPGFGRWTRFIQHHCSFLHAVDVSERCIRFCRKKFEGIKKISFYQNNGQSLGMIPDNSIDFVFSFDSFVHFDQRTIDCYLKEVSKKMKEDSIAFIHHSNIGSLYEYTNHEGWRSSDVSHISFAEACSNNGLSCISQELVNWNDNKKVLSDCFSIFTKSKSKIKNGIIENINFMDEIEIIRNILSPG